MKHKGKTQTYTWWHRKNEHNIAIFLKYNLMQITENGKRQLIQKIH